MIELLNTNNIQIAGGTFGLERETLRVTSKGFMAHTPHPFPNDKQIVKDFCENQTEINTSVHSTVEEVLNELSTITQTLYRTIPKNNEYLWLYSNPPYIKNENDIPIAIYEGVQQEKYTYRIYLAKKYGRYKMTFSGIHVNYSLSEKLLTDNFLQSSCNDFTEYKNTSYLRLAQGLTEYGWIINLLLSASPVCDGSFFNPQQMGKTVVTEYSSFRCGKNGYWNDFTPILSYENILSYAQSIQKYINNGFLTNISEFYYPVRLKSKGINNLDNLVQNGVNHIELRNIDINPFSKTGLDERDLKFIELLILWIYATYHEALSENDQISAVENFKNSALYDIDNAFIHTKNNSYETVRKAGLRVLDEMQNFFQTLPLNSTIKILNYQHRKLTEKNRRYAEKVVTEFSDNYVRKLSEHLHFYENFST